MNGSWFAEIDWNLLRQNYWHHPPGAKNSAQWNKRAVSFARRTEPALYQRKFLELLNPQKEWTVLDVGCGPGTLALPLAERVSRITALDFSANMLALLDQRLQERAITNVSSRLLAWEDDWEAAAVDCHEVAIASRSLNVYDLRAAIIKLNCHARHGVFVTDRLGSGPYDPWAFKALGRTLRTGPDYIFTLNLLHQMGYPARVDFIRLEQSVAYSSFAQAVAAYGWMFPQLTHREEKYLEKYVASLCEFHADASVTLQRKHVPTWAFISWQPAAGDPALASHCKSLGKDI